MSRLAELLRSRRLPQAAVLALMSVGFAGCSADMQTRFSDSSFSNPFASQPEATGSVRSPAAAILQANGYKGPRVLSPGQQLIIPRQTAVAAAAPALAPAASKPVAAAPSVHIVNRGDTLMSIARRNHVPVAELAKANNLDQ